MAYAMKELACDPARIKGMSEKLIVSHYENNYGGAVNRLNAITAQLAFGRTLITKRGEEELVQDHRVAGDQLLPLETIDDEPGGFRKSRSARCAVIALRRLTAPP